VSEIKTWNQRCEEHPDHTSIIVTDQMIMDRMQEEIDELRQALGLYDALPQKKEWVSLTNEEIDDVWKTEYFNLSYEFPRAIEQKLKEKNCD